MRWRRSSVHSLSSLSLLVTAPIPYWRSTLLNFVTSVDVKDVVTHVARSRRLSMKTNDLLLLCAVSRCMCELFMVFWVIYKNHRLCYISNVLWYYIQTKIYISVFIILENQKCFFFFLHMIKMFCSIDTPASLTPIVYVQSKPSHVLQTTRKKKKKESISHYASVYWVLLCTTTDRGTVQKVIVLPRDDLQTEELVLEEVEVFRVSCFL